MDDKEQMRQELRKVPAVAHLGMACMILLVLGVLMFTALQDHASLITRYALVTSAHAIGFLAGFISLRLAPKAVKAHQKNTRLAMILNAVFTVLFGYRLVTLIMNT